MYLFVLHRLARKCTEIYNARAEPLYDSLNPWFCDVFAAVVVCARSLLLWSIKRHDVDSVISVLFTSIYVILINLEVIDKRQQIAKTITSICLLCSRSRAFTRP